ncbi:hypothetical protein A4X13_0g2163 [Tilletia indica]|uniref:Uncharacterized protein n=1 Tax=Tilletia indica TaxID=43049 RepID=A0A177TQX0_9BASI|nr:hypothetical protein A4X13_0g2163 [Tilletia indica]
MTATRTPPFLTPDELRKAQADNRSSKADPWTSRYVRGSLSSLAPPEGSGQGSGSSRASSRSPSPAAETIKSTLASNRGLGSAMPSSINRDLRSSNASSLSGASSRSSISSGRTSTSSTATVSPPSVAADLSVGSDYTSPTLEGSDGTLSKVVGSLIDPVHSRQTWACSGCGVVFARDSTIYASPANQNQGGGGNVADEQGTRMLRDKKGSAYFCRPCYTDRFSIGTCKNSDCGKPVLGSTKEDGKFVKAGEAIWHGRCWRCTLCSRGGGSPPLGDGEPIMVGMDGQPTCEDCFGKKRPTVVPAAARTAAATVQRDGTITKTRPHSTTLVSTTPGSKQTFSVGGGNNGAGGAAHDTRPTSQAMGPPLTSLNRGETIKARPQSLDLTPRPGFARGFSGASMNRFAQNGQGSGTVAELSKRFDSTTATSPRLNLNAFTTPTMSQGLFSASSSTTIAPSSPAMVTTPTMERCPTPKLTRNNSITGSPPKPRPLTASFSAEKGFNLASFNAAGRGGEGAIRRSDSRSRSVSPVKRYAHLPPAEDDDNDKAGLGVGEFGASGDTQPRRTAVADVPTGGRTSPAKSESSSRRSSPERRTEMQEKEADGQDDAMRCVVCGQGAFDGPNQTSDDAVLVTLKQGVQLHAECLQCSICSDVIDPQKTFIRLDDPIYAELAPSLGAFAHPSCAPSVTIQRPAPAAPRESESRARSVDLSDDEEHPTHQRAPRPSQETQPPPSSVAANKTILDFSTNSAAASARQLAPSATKRSGLPNGGVSMRTPGLPGASTTDRWDHHSSDANLRRFQPSAGAAPPTRSSLNVTTRGVPSYMAAAATAADQQRGGNTSGPGLASQRNPAAGIFARRMAEISSKTNQMGGGGGGGDYGGLLNGGGAAGAAGGPARLGGMPTCAGCNTKLSMLESVPGPRGTSWHRACLVCGGDRSDSSNNSSSTTAGKVLNANAPRRINVGMTSAPAAAAVVVCGKKLDSGAKVNVEGRVRCRDCYDREVANRRRAAAVAGGGTNGTGSAVAAGGQAPSGLPAC